MKIFIAQQLINPDPLPKPAASQDTLGTILTVVFVILGALAFLMIVIAGFRMVVSGGNPEKVAEARKQIIYALVGLVIAIMAATIVNFVISRT